MCSMYQHVFQSTPSLLCPKSVALAPNCQVYELSEAERAADGGSCRYPTCRGGQGLFSKCCSGPSLLPEVLSPVRLCLAELQH